MTDWKDRLPESTRGYTGDERDDPVRRHGPKVRVTVRPGARAQIDGIEVTGLRERAEAAEHKAAMYRDVSERLDRQAVRYEGQRLLWVVLALLGIAVAFGVGKGMR